MLSGVVGVGKSSTTGLSYIFHLLFTFYRPPDKTAIHLGNNEQIGIWVTAAVSKLLLLQLHFVLKFKIVFQKGIFLFYFMKNNNLNSRILWVMFLFAKLKIIINEKYWFNVSYWCFSMSHAWELCISSPVHKNLFLVLHLI